MTTLRTPAQLCEKRPGATGASGSRLKRSPMRYAVALPDALVATDRSRPIRMIRSRGRFVPDIAMNLMHGAGRDQPTRSETMPIARSTVSFTAIPIVCCSSSPMSARSIAASVSAARRSGRASRLRYRQRRWLRALDYIRTHPDIWEVILTGGDPLVLSPRRLRRGYEGSCRYRSRQGRANSHARAGGRSCAHHTPNSSRAMKIRRKPTYVAVHVNHPRELTAEARAACARMADAGFPLLSQTVLLAGVNDYARCHGRADARVGRVPDQALLPAPWRPGAGHQRICAPTSRAASN